MALTLKLSELAKLYDFDLDEVEMIVIEREGHVGRERIVPQSSAAPHHHPNQKFNEELYPYVTVELKNGDVLDCKIGKYSWITSCTKSSGCGVPR